MRRIRCNPLVLVAGLWLISTLQAQAAEPFRYPEAKFGAGELRYVNGLPVLTVQGTPEEIGQQRAELSTKAGERLLNYPKDALKRLGIGFSWGAIIEVGRNMVANFPEHHRREMESIVKSSDIERDVLVAGNTMFDIKKFFQCSTVIVEPARSATGGPLFGRNLDFPTLGYLHEYSLVTIYKSPDKNALASIGFPGMIGVLSGMNEHGLAVAVLEVYDCKDKSAAKFDEKGTPYALCFRRVLEDCRTVEEAVKLLKSMKRTTMINLAVCDASGGGVIEITPKSVVFREPQEGVCACTNHFRSRELAVDKRCWRYPILAALDKQAQVGVDAIAAKLDRVNQGKLTLQTMVFEPQTLKLHLAIGECPSSKLKLKTLELKPLFGKPAVALQRDE